MHDGVKITCSDFRYTSNSELVRFFCGFTLADEQTRVGVLEPRKWNVLLNPCSDLFKPFFFSFFSLFVKLH